MDKSINFIWLIGTTILVCIHVKLYLENYFFKADLL